MSEVFLTVSVRPRLWSISPACDCYEILNIWCWCCHSFDAGEFISLLKSQTTWFSNCGMATLAGHEATAWRAWMIGGKIWMNYLFKQKKFANAIRLRFMQLEATLDLLLLLIIDKNCGLWEVNWEVRGHARKSLRTTALSHSGSFCLSTFSHIAHTKTNFTHQMKQNEHHQLLESRMTDVHLSQFNSLL